MGKYNAYGRQLTQGFEKCKLVAYLDSSHPPVPTIAWGETHYPETGLPVKMGDTCTQTQADSWFIRDIDLKGFHFISAWVKVELNDDQYSSLTDFIYNAGCGTFKKYVLSYINTKDFQGACAEMLKHDTAGGVREPGLDRRRRAEVALFLSDYETMMKELNA